MARNLILILKELQLAPGFLGKMAADPVDRRLAEAYVELYRMASIWLKYFWFWCESPLLHVSRPP